MDLQTVFRVSLSKKVSEDAMVLNHHFRVYGVFDGATPLTSFVDSNGRNGAYLASHLFKSYFEKEFHAEMTLTEGIVQANHKLREEMKANQIDLNRSEERWSTCAAIIKLEQEQISFAQLGDCMILAQYGDGKITTLTKDTVKGISCRAKMRRERERRQGLSVPEESYFQSVKNQLIYNKRMANTPDGYSVANGTEEVKDYIQSGALDASGLKAILLMSDGLFHSSLDFIQVFQTIQQIGLEEYVDSLERDERKTGKHSDDKTAILVHITP